MVSVLVVVSAVVGFVLVSTISTILVFYVIRLRRRNATSPEEERKEIVKVKDASILTSDDMTSRCATEFVQAASSDASLMSNSPSDVTVPFLVPHLATHEMTSALGMTSLCLFVATGSCTGRAASDV